MGLVPSIISEWCDFICGRAMVTVRRQREIEEFVSKKYKMTGVQIKIFARELIRRSRTHYGAKPLPVGTKYDLSDEQRLLLKSCVDQICPGGDLGEWSVGELLDHPETTSLNLEIAKATLGEKCTVCKSRQGEYKTIFRTKDSADAWANSHNPKQFSYICEAGNGFHVSSQLRARDAGIERATYESAAGARTELLKIHKGLKQRKGCTQCLSPNPSISRVYSNQMQLQMALISIQIKDKNSEIIICKDGMGWHISSAPHI